MSSDREQDWRPAHVGFAQDDFQLHGVRIWSHPWLPEQGNGLDLPHPAYATQRHRFERYRIETDTKRIHFAAAELSNGVWGFYEPAPYTTIEETVSADGSIRIERRIGEWIGNRYDSVGSWIALFDAASGALIADCGMWEQGRAADLGGGDLLLILQQNYFDVAFAIDTRQRTFRHLIDGEGTRPLSDLALVIERAYRAIGQDKRPLYRRISPDGALVVDLVSIEWGNTHWVNSPRVTEIATGAVLLDLWNTDWDGMVSFPEDGTLALGLRRYHAGGGCSVVIDAAMRRYTITEPEEAARSGPLAEIVPALEVAAASTPMERRPQIQPNPFAAWRTALVLLLGTFMLLAGVAWWTAHQPREPQKLTPIPVYRPS